MSTNTPLMKVVLKGDAKTGKSAIVARAVQDTFSETYKATIGTDFVTKDINNIRLQIWDTAGQENSLCNMNSFHRKPAVIILCYNITDQASFNKITDLLPEAQQIATNNTKFILVGTHADLVDQRQVSPEAVQTLSQTHQLDIVCEVSAKEGKSVEALFTQIAHMLQPKPEPELDDELGTFIVAYYADINNTLFTNPWSKKWQLNDPQTTMGNIRLYAHTNPNSRTARVLNQLEHPTDVSEATSGCCATTWKG